MNFNRIVTGHNSEGKSVFRDDLRQPRIIAFEHVRGMVVSPVWSTQAVPNAEVSADPIPSMTSFVPRPGETRLIVAQFPPDAVLMTIVDPVAAGAEYAQRMPGLAETFEPDNPGMHRTLSVDYGIVIDGELWLELDEGVERHVRAGDIVIQNATRHAWRNKGSASATIAFVLIGAREF